MTDGVAHFEEKYRREADPWNYRDSWYERRKYAVTLACLPRPRYRLVWEPACSIGVLTGLLATRADRVLASDGSPTAIWAATKALTDEEPGRVELAVATLPGPSPAPAGSADLVVLSEILYYLAENDRAAVLSTAYEVLEPDGDLVVVHWRPFPSDAYCSGEDANRWACSQSGWTSLITHTDEQFVLDVLRRA